MFVITELSKNCTVFHQTHEVVLQKYRFKYTNTINNIPMADIDYIISYRGGGNEPTRFKVSVGEFDKAWMEFDTFRDAETYIWKCMYDAKMKCDVEVEEIRKFTEKGKKGIKKGKKNDKNR